MFECSPFRSAGSLVMLAEVPRDLRQHGVDLHVRSYESLPIYPYCWQDRDR